MTFTTYATQQPAVAADARPWTELGHGSTRDAATGNAAVAMVASFLGCMQTISTKRPARHLGGQPT
jgi:hypothetical protein